MNTEGKDYVVGSDTDSIILILDEIVVQSLEEKIDSYDTQQIISFMDKICENKIQPIINKAFNDLAGYTGAYSQQMSMKREALADKGIWRAKKNYVLNVYNNEGVAYNTPQMKIMGLEIVKSSTPTACRVKLKESLDIIMNKSEDDMIAFIDKFRKEFKTLPIEDISFPRGVNGINKYTVKETGLFVDRTPIHTRGSILYNFHIKKKKLDNKYQLITDGEKIKFIYLREPNTIQSNIISFHHSLPNEFGLNKYIDYDTQFVKSFLEPLKSILDCINWKTEKMNSLESFFT